MTMHELDKRVALQDVRIKQFADGTAEIKAMLLNLMEKLDKNHREVFAREEALRADIDSKIEARISDLDSRLTARIVTVQNWVLGVFAASVSSLLGYYITHK